MQSNPLATPPLDNRRRVIKSGGWRTFGSRCRGSAQPSIRSHVIRADEMRSGRPGSCPPSNDNQKPFRVEPGRGVAEAPPRIASESRPRGRLRIKFKHVRKRSTAQPPGSVSPVALPAKDKHLAPGCSGGMPPPCGGELSMRRWARPTHGLEVKGIQRVCKRRLIHSATKHKHLPAQNASGVEQQILGRVRPAIRWEGRPHEGLCIQHRNIPQIVSAFFVVPS